jgi:hypothetical protein
MNEHARHLVAAREHHRASRWVQACEEYSAADRVTPLGIEDLEGWAEAAQVIGRVDEAIDVLARCFERRAQSGMAAPGRRCCSCARRCPARCAAPTRCWSGTSPPAGSLRHSARQTDCGGHHQRRRRQRARSQGDRQRRHDHQRRRGARSVPGRVRAGGWCLRWRRICTGRSTGNATSLGASTDPAAGRQPRTRLRTRRHRSSHGPARGRPRGSTSTPLPGPPALGTATSVWSMRSRNSGAGRPVQRDRVDAPLTAATHGLVDLRVAGLRGGCGPRAAAPRSRTDGPRSAGAVPAGGRLGCDRLPGPQRGACGRLTAVHGVAVALSAAAAALAVGFAITG